MEGIPNFFDIFSWQLILIILVLCVLRAYIKGAQFKEHASARDLIVVVTGASCGIGKQIARELNLRKAKVYMLCHDKEKASAGLAHLARMGCHVDRLVLKMVDMTSFDSIKQFVNEFNSEEDHLDILFNNAGIMLYPKFKLTEDGHEVTWQTNYLGHYYLTELLMGKLRKSKRGARIINVSALAHFYADPIDLDMIDRREKWDSRQSYAKSKLAMVMHAAELTRRLRRDGIDNVSINSCHPGICKTSIVRYTPLGNNQVLSTIASPFYWFFTKTPKDGAQTPLFLALSSKVNGVSGKYFAELQEQKPAELAENELACRALFNYSSNACHLKTSE